MTGPTSETLMLLEFLVEEVEFFYDKANDYIWSGKTAISFQFLDNSPLLVTEDDFADSDRKGRSCLFSMLPHQAEEAAQRFDLNVDVYKEARPGALPRRSKVGEVVVPLSACFRDLFNGDCGCGRVVNGTYPIEGMSGQVIGLLKVFIRISCYGKTIVTQFQMRPDKNIEFKGGDAGYLFDVEEQRVAPPPPPPPTIYPQASRMSQQFPTYEQYHKQRYNPGLARHSWTPMATYPPATAPPINQHQGCCCINRALMKAATPKEPPIVEADKECDGPDTERFVLRIGKKNGLTKIVQRDLELEMCAPKGKPVKPCPQKESQESQYDMLDIPTEYLEKFYGKDKWAQINKAQKAEEERIKKYCNDADDSDQKNVMRGKRESEYSDDSFGGRGQRSKTRQAHSVDQSGAGRSAPHRGGGRKSDKPREVTGSGVKGGGGRKSDKPGEDAGSGVKGGGGHKSDKPGEVAGSGMKGGKGRKRTQSISEKATKTEEKDKLSKTEEKAKKGSGDAPKEDGRGDGGKGKLDAEALRKNLRALAGGATVGLPNKKFSAFKCPKPCEPCETIPPCRPRLPCIPVCRPCVPHQYQPCYSSCCSSF